MEDKATFKDDYAGLQGTLGIRTVATSPERVEMRMDVGPRVHQYMGLLHGGASAALAECAAWTGSRLRIASRKLEPIVTDTNINHLTAKTSGTVTAVAELVPSETDSDVWDIQIRDEVGTKIAVARCTVSTSR